MPVSLAVRPCQPCWWRMIMVILMVTMVTYASMIMVMNIMMDRQTCASETVSALSVEAAAWKTGHFQNSGWPHV